MDTDAVRNKVLKRRRSRDEWAFKEREKREESNKWRNAWVFVDWNG